MAYQSSKDSVASSSLLSPASGVSSGSGGTFISPLIGYASDSDVSSIQNGQSAEATFLDVDGLPLGGTMTIFRGEEPVSQAEVRGETVLPAPVPTSVRLGKNTDASDTFNVIFEPNITGVNLTHQNYVENPIGTVQYGSLEGRVTNIEGEPVPKDTVEGAGLTAFTDENGEYKIVGPGGVETTLLAAGSSVPVDIVGGSKSNVDFVYSRLTVRVVAPDNSFVTGTKVNINNKTLETDENGEVTIPLAPTQEYDIQLGDFKTQEVIEEPGKDIEVTIGNNSSGVDVTVADSVTGEKIGGTTVQVGGSGIASRTNDNGEASSIAQLEGPTPIILGEGDRRYVKKEVVANLSQGEMVEIETELRRRNNPPTL